MCILHFGMLIVGPEDVGWMVDHKLCEGERERKGRMHAAIIATEHAQFRKRISLFSAAMCRDRTVISAQPGLTLG